MNRTCPKHHRILGIAPSTRGFGFVVLEGERTLVDWGVKSVTGDKNTRSIAKVEELITHYQPEVMVLQDHFAKDSRRPLRIRVLVQGIIDLAPSHNVSVALLSREQIDEMFLGDGKGTKHARAEIIAKRFSEELGFELPPKRRAWMKEDARMDIFEAVALALTVYERTQRRRRSY